MATRLPDVYRFGEFTLSSAQRSLTRAGRAVPLTAKAFDLLLYMVQNPCRLLTRDELIHAIWGDVAVEERNLNQNVFTLRKALGGEDDSPGQEQKFILTIAGKGYQFVARVEERVSAAIESFPTASAPVSGPPKLRLEPPLLATVVPEPAPQSASQTSAKPALVMPRRARWTGSAYALAAVFLVMGVATAVYLWQINRPAPPGHIEVVLAELDNQAGDPQFDRSLNTALRIDLQQSPSLVVVGQSRIRNALRQMKRGPDETMTAAVAREVCQRVNGNVMLTPAIANIGGHYLLTITAAACDSGNILGARKLEIDNKAGILQAVDKLADLSRRDIGEPRASIRDFDKRLFETETSSLEAVKAYSDGEHLFNAGKFSEAIALFQRATEIDPNLAIAYADISSAYYDLGDKARSAATITRAYQLRDTVSERERLYILGRYNQSVTGDLVADAKALEQWADMYPNDGGPRANLSNLESWLGNPPMAARYADQYLALNRAEGVHNAAGYEIAVRAYMHNNQFDKALAVCKEAEQNQAETGGLVGLRVEMAALRRDAAEIDRLIAAHRGTPLESRILQNAADAAMYSGQVKRALDLNAQAQVAAHRDNLEADTLDIDANLARNLVEMGMTQQALTALAALPHSDEGMDATYAMAEAGDAAKAEAEVKQRLHDAPNDLMLTHEYAPSVRAALAVRRGKPMDAVALMKPDAPFELRESSVPYLVGSAYLDAGNYADARASFKKILDDPGIDDPLTPLAPLAHLQTGRAWAREGNKPAAAAEYDKFFAAWQNADPDVPVLVQARAERARL